MNARWNEMVGVVLCSWGLVAFGVAPTANADTTVAIAEHRWMINGQVTNRGMVRP